MMSNRNSCDSKKFSPYHRSQALMNDPNRYRLPAIQQTSTPCKVSAENSTFVPPNKDISTIAYATPNQMTGVTTHQNSFISPAMKCDPVGPAATNAARPSYQNCQTSSIPCGSTIPGLYNHLQQTPANRGWSSNEFTGFGKSNTLNSNANKNLMVNNHNNNNKCHPPTMTSSANAFRPSTSRINNCTGQKLVCRDRQLANEILQKAGICSNLPSNDDLEVITDAPVSLNDTFNCDPNPVCMRKPAEHQECYEQSIVVRHLQPPRPAAPPPIIIREHCAPPPPPQSPIVIRHIPARPCTPPPLIIRECPPPMPDTQEPTIIDREVPPPPPPPRQVIFERLPTPPPKPRAIILEKWLPYEEPPNRPCIVEKASTNETPPPKNVIIQYEAAEAKVQPQCIDEGVSCVDPKQFVQEKSNGNAEICYVDQLDHLPDHIKCQLGPQALAVIGLHEANKSNLAMQSNVVRTNPTSTYQQQPQQQSRAIYGPGTPMLSQRGSMTNGCYPGKIPNGNTSIGQQSMNRALSTSASCLPHYHDKYNTNLLARPGNQGLMNFSRAHYNPWATTYQVSYNNRARSMGRAR